MYRYIIRFSTLILILFFSNYNAHAQFGNVFKKAADKVVEGVVEDVSDAVADRVRKEISQRAMKKTNVVLDSIFKERYKENQSDGSDSTHARANNSEIDLSSYEDFLAKMNASAELPAQYNFDVQLDIEIEDYDKNKENLSMLFSKSEAIIGILPMDETQEFDLLIIDYDKDIFAIYDTKNKSMQAIGGMFNMASSMVKSSMTEKHFEDFSITKTGKTKKILNYKCEEYKGDSKDEENKTFIAYDFPINWSDSVGKFGKDFVPSHYNDQVKDIQGFMLKSESKLKSDGKKSKWTTKKVAIERYTVDNSKFEKKSFGEE